MAVVDETAKRVVECSMVVPLAVVTVEQEMGVSWQQGAPYLIEICNLIIRQCMHETMGLLDTRG